MKLYMWMHTYACVFTHIQCKVSHLQWALMDWEINTINWLYQFKEVNLLLYLIVSCSNDHSNRSYLCLVDSVSKDYN